ncbi:MAG: penicillin-binding transpeptidase domain-containing protein [Eubacteriales bacterium]
MRKKDNILRIWAIAVLYAAVALVYIGRLLYLQVSGQDYYSMSTPSRTYTRTVKIQAQRGEIFDRYGNALVSNAYSYDIALDYATLPADEKESCDIIIALVDAARLMGCPECVVEPKESLRVTATSGVGLTFSMSADFPETVRGRRYAKLVSELNVDEDASLEEQARALMLHFGIASRGEEGELVYHYTYEACATLLRLRLDMELSGFSSVSPYVLIKDAPLELLTAAEESVSRGILVQVSATRVYNYPGYASHILGRVNKIPSGELEYYTERGYPMDAVVGVEGVEAAFEEYLRGVDGEMKITEDAYGNILSTEITKEPVAGNDVWLTIDIEMQMVAEKALAENIFKIREEAAWTGKPLTGEDASAGAMTALDTDTGEILAICSYPTYNLATFNEDYAEISSAVPEPLYNRALYGQYAPGSTFKVGVAVAALEEHIIEKNTYIETKGIYMYYADAGFTPRCWLYLLTGQSHGSINVVEAIQESCNYFFYDVGRRLTIEKMNEYSKHFGLGEPTGIELPEKTGILAGPDYRAENGLNQWSPGDTLQAAIGQSDNLFTPLQLSVYLSTVLNGGVRYNAHLLYQVRTYDGQVVYQNRPTIADEIEISSDVLETVREGMRGVMDNGSAASVFSGYTIPVGGKTGTAQVSDKKSENGIMTAFAPFDDPEIVVSCVIEQGSGGTDVGYSVRDVFDYYFRDEIAAAAEPDEDGEEEDGEE